MDEFKKEMLSYWKRVAMSSEIIAACILWVVMCELGFQLGRILFS